MKTEWIQVINGQEFTIGQVPCGEHAEKWVWSTTIDESVPFETAAQAQQDAMRYVREQDEPEVEDNYRAETTASFDRRDYA